MAFLQTILYTFVFVTIVFGHSQMRCAKYNKDTGACDAPIRGTGYAFMQEAYDLTNGKSGICQFSWANPISSYYSNGASCYDWASCPGAMGNFTPGESFTIMWFARNHAVSNQSPGNVHLYLSPIETQNQGSDVSKAVMQQTVICSAPYMSCGGINQDTTPCTTTCTFPSVPSGLYTMMWLWDWTGHDQYSTCADILVLNGQAAPTPTPSTPVTTGKASPVTTGKASPVTTGKVVSAATSTSTGNAVPSTTGSRPASAMTTGKVASVATTGKVATPTPTPIPSSPSTPSGTCTVGQRKCATSETFYICTKGRSAPYWAGPQSCNSGTTCTPSGDQIYCY